MGDSVSLFRCKKCQARMFEKDCAGHLARHGVEARQLTAGQILTHFDRGPKTASARPGDNVQPLNYRARGRKPKAEGEPPSEAEEDLN